MSKRKAEYESESESESEGENTYQQSDDSDSDESSDSEVEDFVDNSTPTRTQKDAWYQDWISEGPRGNTYAPLTDKEEERRKKLEHKSEHNRKKMTDSEWHEYADLTEKNNNYNKECRGIKLDKTLKAICKQATK